MKPLERIPILTNVLIVACERPATEIGKLVKAVVACATKGVKPSVVDIRLETYFGLIAQDLDAQRTAAEVKSRKCSESARCRTAKSPAKPSTVTRKTVCEPVQDPANAEEGPTDADADEVVSNVNAADDAAQSFERLKAVYDKTGTNGLQASELWKKLSEEDRSSVAAQPGGSAASLDRHHRALPMADLRLAQRQTMGQTALCQHGLSVPL